MAAGEVKTPVRGFAEFRENGHSNLCAGHAPSLNTNCSPCIISTAVSVSFAALLISIYSSLSLACSSVGALILLTKIYFEVSIL